MAEITNVEEFRNYAHRGAEVKDLTPEGIADTHKEAVVLGPCEYLLVSADNYMDFLASKELARFFDPTSRHSLIEAGCVGAIMGMVVFTDAVLEESKRFITGKARIITTPVMDGHVSE